MPKQEPAARTRLFAGKLFSCTARRSRSLDPKAKNAAITAHSREFSEDAFKRAGEPKELFIVPGGHVDLYDRVNLIPFAKLTEFFRSSLK